MVERLGVAVVTVARRRRDVTADDVHLELLERRPRADLVVVSMSQVLPVFHTHLVIHLAPRFVINGRRAG